LKQLNTTKLHEQEQDLQQKQKQTKKQDLQKMESTLNGQIMLNSRKWNKTFNEASEPTLNGPKCKIEITNIMNENFLTLHLLELDFSKMEQKQPATKQKQQNDQDNKQNKHGPLN